MRSRLLRLFIQAVFLVTALYLPVIPIQTAPVVENQIYHLKFIALKTTLTPTPVGVSEMWYWYSYLAAIVLLGLAYLLGATISRLIPSKSE